MLVGCVGDQVGNRHADLGTTCEVASDDALFELLQSKASGFGRQGDVADLADEFLLVLGIEKELCEFTHMFFSSADFLEA